MVGVIPVESVIEIRVENTYYGDEREKRDGAKYRSNSVLMNVRAASVIDLIG
jgi:hypothetical protein